jgi:predicted metalloprotease with PDZ domain
MRLAAPKRFTIESIMPIRNWLTAALLLAPLYAQNPVRLRVDATDAPRRVFHVQMTMPAKPGPLTLLYPEWIPGEHGPTGPIANLVGLQIKSGGQTIPWRRDSVNLYAFHIEVPAGAASLDVAFDFIAPPDATGFSSSGSTTSELAVLSWNQLILYPQGAAADSVQYQANLRVPPSWRYGTALPIERESGNEIEFKPASLTTLIDSPLSTGRHYRTVGIGTENGIPHYVHLAGDSDESVAVSDELVAQYKNLVTETGALFGARHYRDYHFLVTLSDHVAHFGLEHHESSDNRVKERTLIEASGRKVEATLLAHEFTHSWNGKYRRPGGLIANGADGGYDTPMKGDLLWVYEGLTNYLGEVLAGRSGLWTPEDYRDQLAATAAELDTRSGRAWRPLEDTAVFAQVLYDTTDDFREYRRSTDYYEEGSLIWLEVDTLIRQLSKGAKSLDDFCRAFHGAPGGAPAMKPYEFEDVVKGLSAIQAYDWSGFFNQRLHSTAPRAPLGGIERGGWKLAYTPERSEWWKANEEYRKQVDLSYSIGIKVNEEDGTIIDIAYEGPARKAGVTPSTKLIAVNNRGFTPVVLREAVKATATGQQPIELLIKNGEFYEVHRLDYHGGERYPHLVRDQSVPDLLSQVTAPLARR